MSTFNINSFSDWRNCARYSIHHNISPEDIEWQENHSEQNSLFESAIVIEPTKLEASFNVPRQFITLANKVAYHRDLQKWALLYTALWRIVKGEKKLLDVLTDPITHQIMMMRKAVERDTHKMKAFVRFKLYQRAEQQYYVAWYKPQHNILELVAPFFQERFSVMQWAIFTPDGYVAWNGQELLFDKQVIHIDEISDQTETLWLTYYRSIFNPARIKLKAMYKEMPKYYWGMMPETKLISGMLQEAPQRVVEMLKLDHITEK